MSSKASGLHDSIATRLAKLFSPGEPEGDAAQAAADRLDQIDRRIAATREEVKRAVRSREGRFRL